MLGAIKLYLTLANTPAYAKYARMDKVLFNLADMLNQAKRNDRARVVFGELIRNYPQSRDIPDAYLSFAEHYFNEGEVEEALRRYEQVARWIEKYREDYAVFARIRLGTASTIESMGLDVFSLMLYDDPDLVKEIHRRFSEWSVRVLEHLNRLDLDFYWVADDHADTKAPWVNMEMYEEFLYPFQKTVADAISKPWALHSDGNLFPILDGLLELGMNAIHPIQPSAMDIGKMKAQYGSRVCLIGNIDLDYTLTLGTPEEVDAEVKQRIAAAAGGGGYIISSGNSLTDYCKIENVRAMAEAVGKYGKY